MIWTLYVIEHSCISQTKIMSLITNYIILYFILGIYEIFSGKKCVLGRQKETIPGSNSVSWSIINIIHTSKTRSVHTMLARNSVDKKSLRFACNCSHNAFAFLSDLWMLPGMLNVQKLHKFWRLLLEIFFSKSHFDCVRQISFNLLPLRDGYLKKILRNWNVKVYIQMMSDWN